MRENPLDFEYCEICGGCFEKGELNSENCCVECWAKMEIEYYEELKQLESEES